MKSIGIDELKTIQLEMLDVVAKFCEERGINYWVDSGTLLGAIRHKGYIPWDDDIDVGMLRPDYDRFIQEFNGTYPRYEFHCIENDPDFYKPFGKVYDKTTVLYEPDESGVKMAVNIDIFVYDNAPDNALKCRTMLLRHLIYTKLNDARVVPVFKRPNGNVIRKILVYILRAVAHIVPYRFMPYNYFAVKAIQNSRRYIHENTKRVGNFTGLTPITWSKEIFRSFIDVEFEGRKYKAPVGYDEWLRGFYGDYMQLPPEKERYSRHSFKAYWIHE